MRYFKYILFVLFLAGCGVMSSPKEDDKTSTKGSVEAGANVDQNTPSFAKSIKSQRVLLKSFSDLNNSYLSYKLINDDASLKTIIEDLNLSYEDNQTLLSVDLNSSYLLYYPIKRSSDCGFLDTIVEDQNITKITIKENLQDCKNMIIYYLPFYKLENSVTEIEINAFGEKEDIKNISF
jgi:hypothetical protein